MGIKAKNNNRIDAARKLVAAAKDDPSLLDKLALAKSAGHVKRLTASEQTHPQRAAAWRKLAGLLATLAPTRPRPLGRAIQFFIPDGKYFLQVFSLDDVADGSLMVCCEDVLTEAIAAGVLAPQSGQPDRHLCMGTAHAIHIERIDGKTENVPPHCNAMVGWNRHALKIVLPESPTREQCDAAGILCALSGLRWQTPAAAPVRA